MDGGGEAHPYSPRGNRAVEVQVTTHEVAARVAAGALARKIVPGLIVRGALVAMGTKEIDRDKWDWEEVDRNPFFTPDAEAAEGFDDWVAALG